MVKYSRTSSGSAANQQLGIDIDSDIPERRSDSPLAPRDDYHNGKYLKNNDDTSSRNCKIITGLWALLTAGIVFIAQSGPPEEPPPPLHWSAAVISEARRASFVLENQMLPKRTAECNVRSLGAVGDGETLDTSAINKALKLCAGHGVVVVPGPGVYAVETIRLPSAVTLRVEEGAVLLAGAGARPPLATVMYPFAPLLSVRNATNVRIEGRGTLRGRGLYWTKNPFGGGAALEYKRRLRSHAMIDIFGSSDVLVHGLTLEDSVACSLRIRSSSLVVVDDILLNNTVVEQDHTGILIESSQTVEVAHSTLYTGGSFAIGVRSGPGSTTADVVVLENTIYNASGVGIMAPSGGLVRDVVFKNLYLDGSFAAERLAPWRTGGLLLRASEASDTSMAAAAAEPQVSRVLFEGVVGRNLTYGIDVEVLRRPLPPPLRKGEERQELPPAEPQQLLGNIEFHDITVDFPLEYQVRLVGPASAPITNLVMKDVLFRGILRYGWECDALAEAALSNVVPDVPLECTPHEDPPPPDYAVPLPNAPEDHKEEWAELAQVPKAAEGGEPVDGGSEEVVMTAEELLGIHPEDAPREASVNEEVEQQQQQQEQQEQQQEEQQQQQQEKEEAVQDDP